tara:strand:+ start:201 stop:821 length:621 start_codon:yes stop_codon:yes gene_type:complete
MKVGNTPAPAQISSQKKAEKTEESKLPFPIPQAAQPVHQPDTRYNSVRGPEDHKQSITLRRSYVMVVSSYEKVAQRQQLTDKAAEQFAETLQLRLNTLNEQALREIQELPEFKRLETENIRELGEELVERMQDEQQQTEAFALLKNPKFAEYMESKDSAQRSFAEQMQDFGSETLMFGALEMIKDFGGLAGLSDAGNSKGNVSIKV